MVKTGSAKNRDALVAPKDERMLNYVHSTDYLSDICLGARAQVLLHTTEVETSIARTFEDDDMDTNEPLVPEEPLDDLCSRC